MEVIKFKLPTDRDIDLKKNFERLDKRHRNMNKVDNLINKINMINNKFVYIQLKTRSISPTRSTNFIEDQLNGTSYKSCIMLNMRQQSRIITKED